MSIFYPLKKGVCTIALAATVILTWANNLEAQTLSDDPVHAPHHVLSAEAREHTTEVAPGALPYSPETRTQLQKTLADKGPDYEPRTEHVEPDGRPRFTNRLILEDSPYLIQHAHNPVNWFAWGPQAFERAKREGKPIFLSIGYSTCHWCHVMERESFDNLEIARILNEKFISIKVDRERRPDLDEVYMTSVRLITGQGGWPMSNFLTPEGKPFFGGTYFPPEHFEALLRRIDEVWRTRKQEVLASANQITAAVLEITTARSEAQSVSKATIAEAVTQILGQHDTELGGFGAPPKFPREPELLLLLETALRSGDAQALAAAEHTLEAMARGGIFDQIAGGFHRYSTDARWLVPHFEKMLYNQAHLARAYLAAFQLTGKSVYGRVARQTLEYVLRDMRSPEGGFYSATDADSEGKEGEFFLWTTDQLRNALGEDAALAIDLYGATDQGNFESKNILHLPTSLESYAQQQQLPLPGLLERVDRIREKLRLKRAMREHPLRDEKILSAWNGMMITTLAQAYDVFGDDGYLQAATRAANFIWSHNRSNTGDLLRIFLAGSASTPASQDDYAYLLESIITLFDVTGDPLWLQRAEELARGMLQRFWDDEHGGFFMSADNVDPHLIARPKSPYDSAVPSGNSVAVRSLAMLGARSGDLAFHDKANATVAAFSATIRRYPAGYSYMLLGTGEVLEGSAGPRQYGAQGHVSVNAHIERGSGKTLRLVVDLVIQEGWHINAHQPLQASLIPTVLTVDGHRGQWRLGSVDYPPSKTVELAFQQEPLALYLGNVQLAAPIGWNESEEEALPPVVPVRLKIQACNDEICLLPEELLLEVPTSTLLERVLDSSHSRVSLHHSGTTGLPAD